MRLTEILEWLGPDGKHIWPQMEEHAITILKQVLPPTSTTVPNSWTGSSGKRSQFAYELMQPWIEKYKKPLNDILYAKGVSKKDDEKGMKTLVSAMVNCLNRDHIKPEDRTYPQARRGLDNLKASNELKKIRSSLDWLPEQTTSKRRPRKRSSKVIEPSTVTQQNDQSSLASTSTSTSIGRKRNHGDDSITTLVEAGVDDAESGAIDEETVEPEPLRNVSEPSPSQSPQEIPSPTSLQPTVRKSIDWSNLRIALRHPSMTPREVPTLSLEHWLKEPDILKDHIPPLRYWLHVNELDDSYKDDLAIHKYFPGKMLQDLTFRLRTIPGHEKEWKPFSRMQIVEALKDWKKFVEGPGIDFSLDPNLVIFDLSGDSGNINDPVA